MNFSEETLNALREEIAQDAGYKNQDAVVDDYGAKAAEEEFAIYLDAHRFDELH